MTPIESALNLLRHKVTGAATHSPFRVGMVLAADPTPFILAGETLKVVAPRHHDNLVVTGVGTLTIGAITLTRLYLDGDETFLQVGVDGAGAVNEVRWFTRHDQETPSGDDWAVWLDQNVGMIGFGQFQTLDGKLYDRRWSPGDARVWPIEIAETIKTAQGEDQRAHKAMLYSAPTDLPSPAPDTEYLLVSAVSRGAEAWVDLHAGIDINPVALGIA